MFRSRKTDKIKYVAIGEIKDWRDAGHELELMATRLDYARKALKKCKVGTWAHRHWAEVESNLLYKWKLMITLKDTGLRQKSPSSTVNYDYNWWERSEEVGMTFDILGNWLQNRTDEIGLQARLDESWNRAREQKLQKARQGLA
jgi:hypothetical protein